MYTAYSSQSRVLFLVSLIVVAIAIILIGIDLILVSASNVFLTTVIPITFAANIISGLIFAYVRAINNRRDELNRQLRILDETYIGMNYITRVPTQEKDEAIVYLVEQLLSSAASESKVKSREPLAMNPEEKKVLAAFENPKYNWRTIEGIAKETELPTADIIRVLESNNQIIRATTPDKHGRVLYTTKSYYKSRKNLLNHILSVLSDQVK